MIEIKRGLDLPIGGEPAMEIRDAPRARSLALIGPDYPGLRATMLVREGDRVRRGAPLFSDKKTPGLTYVAPGGGTVAAINRGERRRLLSLVIDLDPSGEEEIERFDTLAESQIHSLGGDAAAAYLRKTGLWTALRTRPYSKVPTPDSRPTSIFVNAMDTRPLAPDPVRIISPRNEDFRLGLKLLSRIAKLHLCKAAGAELPDPQLPGVQLHEFAGPHPAGLPGTHIHFLDPVSATRSVWFLDCQDCIAIGESLRSGQLSVERVVSLAGPQVAEPSLVRTRLGANLNELCAGRLRQGDTRLVSGSVLYGHRAAGAMAYLGRYHSQVTALVEGGERRLMSWLQPGIGLHSALAVFVSSLLPRRRFAMNTLVNGGDRAIVPVGVYEEVMPLDVLATPLLRYLVVGDTEMAQKLGALEMDPEDLSLCTYVCPSKYDFGAILQGNLERIEQGG